MKMKQKNTHGKLSGTARRQRHLLTCIEAMCGDAGRQEIIEFAKFLEVSEGAVKKWIYGHRRPRYHTMKRIAKLTEGRMGIDDW